MEFAAFKSSLAGAAPPAGASGALQALWWQARGDWHQGHRCAQDQADDKGAWVGFDLDIAAAVAKRLGVRVEMVKVDELTRISYLQNGKIDLAVASISKTKKRGEQVDFSQTYFFSTQTFLVRKGQINSYEDLVGKKVGASRGSSSIGEPFERWSRISPTDRLARSAAS